MKYMLDTNICIYAIKRKPESVFRKMRSELSSGLCISSITLAELQNGVEKSQFPEKNTRALVQFLTPFTILHAKSQNLILVTNNTREFKRVPELQLENWVEL